MVFAQALKKALTQEKKEIDISIEEATPETDPQRVPLMYRAQVEGRCSLQFAGNNTDLTRWLEEWIYPQPNNQQPSYQRELPALGLQGTIYRLKIEFPFRVSSNSGQDSIIRPIFGKQGIPFIPGSSIKGLFQRLTLSQQVSSDELRQKIREYCGTDEIPGTLRFHGAYPVGDWAQTRQVTYQRRGEQITETRYRIADIIHPQEKRQVESNIKTSAYASISLYQPTLIFELSSIQPLSLEEWKEVAGLLKRALRQGLGGKTSTGYGLWVIPQDRYPLSITLCGIGVSPLLRSNEPEFRPNLFKASLRGHISRLLAGVCDNQQAIKKQINHLFGHTEEPGSTEIYWESHSLIEQTQGIEATPIYQTKGTLHLAALPKQQELLRWAIEFAYLMGGLGKSWRRTWHKGPESWHPGFFPQYDKRALGCHWQWLDSNFEPRVIKSGQDLCQFLQDLRSYCINYMGTNSSQFSPWREAWHPQRVSVYAQVVSQSQVINLFHQENFKTTPAIGGRHPGDDHPTSVSCVWHRMLPIEANQYLEIITMFHGDRSLWKRQNQDQLLPFVRAIEQQGLDVIWGQNFSQ